MTQSAHRQDPLWKQAEVAASRKDWPQAIALFEKLLEKYPKAPDILLQLSYMHSLAGHYRDAHYFTLQAHRSVPREPEVVGELIARLRTFNDAEALHEAIQRLGPLSRLPIPLLLQCASQLSNLNEQEKALALLDEAYRADPYYPPTLLSRGQVLIYLGRFEDAEKSLNACHRRAPEIAQLYWLLSRLKKQTKESNRIPQIQNELRRPGRKPDEIALLGYAMHKECDDIGEYPNAWRALELACRAKRSTLRYSPQQTHEFFAKLMEFPWNDGAAAARQHSSDRPASDKTPIFIVGMHRSGTTLLEQLLDGHSQVMGIGELYDFTTQMREATDHHCRGVIDSEIVERAHGVDFDKVGAGYLNGVRWRLGAQPYFTDKLPSNFQNIGFICRALPHAKILHLRRDAMETCFSNLRELFSDACPYSYDQSELADFFNQYSRLMAHWHRTFPNRILDVDYAELTSEPEHVMRKVAAFCGLQYEPEMLNLNARSRGVATASAVQVRGEIRKSDRQKWKPYEPYLQSLLRGLHIGSM